MTCGTLAALLVVVGVCSSPSPTQAQSDYDSNAGFGPTEQSQGKREIAHSALRCLSSGLKKLIAAGLPVLAPNGCRAKGFSATTVNNGQKVCRNRLVFLDQFNGLDAATWRKEVQISDEPVSVFESIHSAPGIH